MGGAAGHLVAGLLLGLAGAITGYRAIAEAVRRQRRSSLSSDVAMPPDVDLQQHVVVRAPMLQKAAIAVVVIAIMCEEVNNNLRHIPIEHTRPHSYLYGSHAWACAVAYAETRGVVPFTASTWALAGSQLITSVIWYFHSNAQYARAKEEGTREPPNEGTSEGMWHQCTYYVTGIAGIFLVATACAQIAGSPKFQLVAVVGWTYFLLLHGLLMFSIGCFYYDPSRPFDAASRPEFRPYMVMSYFAGNIMFAATVFLGVYHYERKRRGGGSSHYAAVPVVANPMFEPLGATANR